MEGNLERVKRERERGEEREGRLHRVEMRYSTPSINFPNHKIFSSKEIKLEVFFETMGPANHLDNSIFMDKLMQACGPSFPSIFISMNE